MKETYVLCENQGERTAVLKKLEEEGYVWASGHKPTEYKILKMLLEKPSEVVTKSSLIDKASSENEDCTESSLKTHISHLRGKLKNISGKDYIESVWGIGFKMK